MIALAKWQNYETEWLIEVHGNEYVLYWIDSHNEVVHKQNNYPEPLSYMVHDLQGFHTFRLFPYLKSVKDYIRFFNLNLTIF